MILAASVLLMLATTEQHANVPAEAGRDVGTHADAADQAGVDLGGSAHAFSVYARTGAMLYLSAGQTAGGLGGGFGVRDTIHDRILLQVDLTQLSMIGTALAVRVGAGVQRQGTYAPAAWLTATVFVGDRLRFLTPAHPAGVRAPASALGVTLAPLRFRSARVDVSLLELGLGAGWDWPGLGATYNVTLLEIGTRF